MARKTASRKKAKKGASRTTTPPRRAKGRAAKKGAARKATPRASKRPARRTVARKPSRAASTTTGKPARKPARHATGRRAADGAARRSPSKIVPHLWFDKEARQAAEFYTSLFPDSGIDGIRTLRDTPSGDCDVVSFHLSGQDFMAISAGPPFRPNPSISFILNFDPSRDKKARANLDAAWKALVDGGQILMPLQEYPFSKRYGWLQDRYGLSWQLILPDPSGEPRPFIVPSLMFTGGNAGRAEEAIDLYTSVFKGSRRGNTARYPKGMEPEREGTLMFADFMLEGQWFAAMDSARQHGFGFNEAISLLVRCASQEEIDAHWARLSAVPEAERCGWLKDRFGVSWQIAPMEMDAMMKEGTQEQIDRVTQAFLPMKKFDVAALRKAYAGKAR